MHRFFKLALGAALLAGCGGGTNEAREDNIEDTAARYGLDVEVNLDESGETDQVVINQGGGQVGQGLNLPDGFPGDIDFPIAWNVMAASSPMPNGYSIQALTESSTGDIVAELRERLAAKGWTETAFQAPTPQMSQIGFEKDERMANFNILENGETRAVQLVTMPKP